MRMYSGWNFARYYRPSCYGLFNKDNLHEVHEGPQYDSFFLGCSCICTNQHNKSLFFLIHLSYFWCPHGLKIWFKGELGEHYRKCAHRVPSRPLHLWSVAGEGTLCCRCASCHSLSPENAIYQAGTGRAGPYLYGSNAVSCGSVGEVLTQE